MRFIRVLVALLIAGSIGLMAGVPVGAQLPTVTLSPTPDTVILGPAETAQVVVVAHIPVADVESIVLSSFSDLDVAVKIADPVRSQPPLQGDQVWDVTITRSGKGQSSGKVYFRAEYQVRQSDGRLLPGVALASVDIQERTPDPAPTITLSLTPDTVALSPAETAQVVVVARIPVEDVESIALSSFSDMEVGVEIADPVRSELPLQGDQVWEVTLTRSGKGQPTGKVYFSAEYQQRQSDGRLLPGVVSASLDIQERVPDPIEEVITAKLETSLDTLQDQQTRQVFVVVSNISDVPVTVTRIETWPISHVTTTVEDLDGGVRLDPQEAHPFALILTADDQVQPGKHLLVVRVDAEWERGGRPMAGSLVLNQEFEASAFGESAILQVMGIPSLLFLPGFLFVTTLILLWGRWYPKEKLLGLELDFRKADFLWAAVTLSLVVVVLYPWLTGSFLPWLLRRPMDSRNLLQGYGFDDIVGLWLGAVLTGFLLWLVGNCLRWLWGLGKKLLDWLERRKQAELDEQDRQERARLVPATEDRPLDALKKIAANELWLGDVEAFKFKKGNKEQTVFQLPCPDQFAEPGKVWVAPGMDPKSDDDAALEDLSALAGDAENFGQLIAKLEEFENAGTVSLEWDSSGSLVSKPTPVDEGDITEKVTGEYFWPL